MIYMLRLLDIRDKILFALVFVSLGALTLAGFGLYYAKDAHDTIHSWERERNERVAETKRLQGEYDMLLKWYKEKYGYSDEHSPR